MATMKTYKGKSGIASRKKTTGAVSGRRATTMPVKRGAKVPTRAGATPGGRRATAGAGPGGLRGATARKKRAARKTMGKISTGRGKGGNTKLGKAIGRARRKAY